MDINKLIRNHDGYVNATQLCKMNGRQFKRWMEYSKTKPFINKISELYNLSEDKLMHKSKGGGKGDKVPKTWVHPTIATNIAQWISVEFAAHVSKWIEEWKEKKENNEKYQYEINNIKPDDPYSYKEREIQERLYKELGGVKEYKTINGNVDLLTDNELIEIKVHENWKHGIGQLLAYSTQLRGHKLRLHLFDGQHEKNIEDVCKEFSISVTWETS